MNLRGNSLGFLPSVLLATPLMVLAPTLAAETQAPADAQTSENDAKVAAVQAHVDAYRTGNIERFLDTFTPDAEVYMDGNVFRGRAQLRQLYGPNFMPGAPSIKVYDSAVTERFVLLSAGFVLPNGEEVCCSSMEIEVRDGKVSYMSSNYLVIYQNPDGSFRAP